MSTATSSTSGIPMAVWNIVCAIGFMACCVGGVITGVNVLHSTHRWGLLAVAVCFGLVGLIGIIRQCVFSARGERDEIIFYVNFTLSSLPWTLAALGLTVLGVVLFFVSPPF
jgi:bacteriorhodopsin